MGRASEWFVIAIITLAAAAISLGAAFGPSVSTWQRQPHSVYAFLSLLVVGLLIVPAKAGLSIARRRKAKQKPPRYFTAMAQMVSLFGALAMGGVFALHGGRPWPMYESHGTWLLETTHLLPSTMTSSAALARAQEPPRSLARCASLISVGLIVHATDPLDKIPECLSRRGAVQYGLGTLQAIAAIVGRGAESAELAKVREGWKAVISKYGISGLPSAKDEEAIKRLMPMSKAFANDVVEVSKALSRANANVDAKGAQKNVEEMVLTANARAASFAEGAAARAVFDKIEAGYRLLLEGLDDAPSAVVWEQGAWRLEYPR